MLACTHLVQVESTYAPGLALSSSTNFFGSDHVPFLDAGFSELPTIENDYEAYPFYHSSDGTLANQNGRFQSMADLTTLDSRAVGE